MIKNPVWLYSPGHGGMLNGEYMTPAKDGRYYSLPDGRTIYEGVVVRKFTDMLMKHNNKHGVKSMNICATDLQISLGARTNISNILHADFDLKTVHFAIHCNAGGGVGTEVYTTVGTTSSDKYAQSLLKYLQKSRTDIRIRHDRWSDDDLDKEKNWYELMYTNSPAMLWEIGFMDTHSDAYKLLDDKWLDKLAEDISLWQKSLK